MDLSQTLLVVLLGQLLASAAIYGAIRADIRWLIRDNDRINKRLDRLGLSESRAFDASGAG